MNLDALRKEYEIQDNRLTAYPIYVQVQEKFCVGVIADGHSVNCPYGDGETKTEYIINSDGDPDSFDTREEAEQSLIEQYYGDDKCKLKEAIKNIQEKTIGYIWHPVEFFLTIKGAKEYMKANSHNHGELRTYVSHFERRNFEMRELLKELNFKTRD